MLKAARPASEASSSHPMSSGRCRRSPDALFHDYPEARAKLAHLTMRTIRIPRKATTPPVPNQQMTKQRPSLLWNKPHQVLLNLFGVLFFGQSKPLRQARHMRVHHHAHVDVKGVSEHDVRGLAADAAERDQFVHRAGNITAETLGQRLAASLDAPGLIAKKTGRLNFLFQDFG